MLDPLMRKLMDEPLNTAAELAHSKISANSITIIGFFIGILSFIAVSQGYFTLALVFLLLNRLADGLDGPIARKTGATDLGGYLDITADFLLWALLPLGFALYAPENSLAVAVLLSSFAMSITVFLSFAVMAEKRQLSTETQGKKSFFYLAGLVEGAETIGFFVFVMLLPQYFIPAALVFSGLVYLSVFGRLIISIAALRED